MSDSVVILAHPTALATKRFTLAPDKRTLTESYGEGKYFRAETVPLEGLGDLYDLLELLAHDTRAFLVRGELIPGTQLDHCRRLKKQNGTDAPTLREVPRRWLMLDIDGAQAPVDWGTPAGCAAAANTLLGLLPMELRTAGHIWQASASAGIRPGLRMHYFFWLDRALGETDLERWGESVNDVAGKKILDLAVFRTIQPLYVAEPLFENVINPVAQRLGYVPGVPAILPKLNGRGEVWRRKLEPLYYESNDKIHDHVRDACASYFFTNGAQADDEVLRKALIAGTTKALELQGLPGEYTPAKIEAEIASGRSFVASNVEVGENLLLDNRGQPRGTVSNIIDVMRGHEDWRGLLSWNARVGQIEFLKMSPWGSRGAWTDADSVHATSWFAREKRMGVDDGTLLRAAMAMARAQEIDPVAEWLLAVEWTGPPLIDTWMINWCGAEDCEYVRRVSRMFMVGCVARALIPGCKHDTVLVLQGETGCGKSTLVETLATDPWYAAVTEEKDLLQKIHGPWLVELPELGPFRSMHYNRIKSFTSTRVDRFRAPYMRLPEDRKRTCALVATLNDDGVGWNEDPTSARRFWPVDVGQIDRVAVGQARGQLFAEAVAAFKAGESWWVEDAKDPLFTARQETVYARDEWETILARTLRDGGGGFGPNGRSAAFPANPPEFTIADLVGAAFQRYNPDKRDQQRAAAVLIRLGYVNNGAVWHK